MMGDISKLEEPNGYDEEGDEMGCGIVWELNGTFN